MEIVIQALQSTEDKAQALEQLLQGHLTTTEDLSFSGESSLNSHLSSEGDRSAEEQSIPSSEPSQNMIIIVKLHN